MKTVTFLILVLLGVSCGSDNFETESDKNRKGLIFEVTNVLQNLVGLQSAYADVGPNIVSNYYCSNHDYIENPSRKRAHLYLTTADGPGDDSQLVCQVFFDDNSVEFLPIAGKFNNSDFIKIQIIKDAAELQVTEFSGRYEDIFEGNVERKIDYLSTVYSKFQEKYIEYIIYDVAPMGFKMSDLSETMPLYTESKAQILMESVYGKPYTEMISTINEYVESSYEVIPIKYLNDIPNVGDMFNHLIVQGDNDLSALTLPNCYLEYMYSSGLPTPASELDQVYPDIGTNDPTLNSYCGILPVPI